MTSIIRGDDDFDSAGIVRGTAKAWVYYDATTAILASFGVSSITDNGAGDTDVNFSEVFADANYLSATDTPMNSSGPTQANLVGVTTKAAGSANVLAMRVVGTAPTYAFVDASVNVAFFAN